MITQPHRGDKHTRTTPQSEPSTLDRWRPGDEHDHDGEKGNLKGLKDSFPSPLLNGAGRWEATDLLLC